MANESSNPISTPKKVALALLGALVLLTFVNLIEAAVNKYTGDEHEVLIGDVEVHVDVDRDYHHEDDFKIRKVTSEGELMIEERFKVSAGDHLSVNVGDADIMVLTGETDEAHVEVYLESNNMSKAREYFENQRFEVKQEAGTVYVLTRPVRKNYSGIRFGSMNIQVKVAIPSEFNVNLKTSDGDVALEELEGEVSISTSDGDIATGNVVGSDFMVRTSDGDIRTESIESETVSITTSDGDIKAYDIIADDVSIRTSDGDIGARNIEGNAAISTSDGDLRVNSFSGSELALRTSDGEIMADEVDAETSQFQTSDGNIRLKRVRGSLTAKTSSGDVYAEIEEAGSEIYLNTVDGDIELSVPGNLGAELSLKGERVRVSSSFSFDGQLKKNHADGVINGGGTRIEARTSDGSVIFREN